MEDFGNGVSRTLSALARQFQVVVAQAGAPPLDSEENLRAQVDLEALRQAVRSQVHSGFFLDPTRPYDDYVFDPLQSNQFLFGTQQTSIRSAELDPVVYANVNGWIIPVAGTRNPTDNSTPNVIQLNPPPRSGSRVDFVFLEVWRAIVSPNPSVINKPAPDKVWKHGNVEFGQDNIDDDLIDPAVGFETSLRVQLQYRIRVVGAASGASTSPDLNAFPDGLGDPSIRAQGPLDAPSTLAFDNMREELNDPSLWRAGDGDPLNELNTVDGYVYAIPICAVFRRNASPFVAANIGGTPNQNGAFERTPSTITLPDPRLGATLLTQMSLVNDLPPQQFAVDTLIEVDNVLGSGLDDPLHNLSNVFLKIDNEIVAVSAVNTAVFPNTITIPAGGRGRGGTDITSHTGRTDPLEVGSGTQINFFNTRSDGLFADQIAQEDVLDLRRGLNIGDWDYERLLLHNISQIMRGRLRTTWKTSGVAGGDTRGSKVTEVDYLYQEGSVPSPIGSEALDGPDGIRQVWSDAAAIQTDVSLLLDPQGTMNAGFIQTLDDLVTWEVGADFKPSAFMNNQNNATPGWTNGTTIFLHIGGDDGNQGARKTFRDGGTRAVRFVSPREYWRQADESTSGLQTPVTFRIVSSDLANQGIQAPGAGLQALSPAGPGEPQREHPGPFYPLQYSNFERPFIVLGGLLNNALQVTGIDTQTQLITIDPITGDGEIELPGVNFDVPGDWFSLDANGDFENDPSDVNFPVLRGQRTLFGMLSKNGRDRSGASSEVYLILYGDAASTDNNGAFKVLGAGTVGYTNKSASAPNRLRVVSVTGGVGVPFDNSNPTTVTAEVRSQFTNSEDGPGSSVGPASMTITLTDLQGGFGGSANPWNTANINPSLLPGRSLEPPFDFKAVLSTTILYHPGRGATARVGTELNKVAIQAPSSPILRQSPAVLDPAFASASGIPSSPVEVTFDPTHVQLWNRLGSQGLPAPKAPFYGGRTVLFSEADRENETFFDLGSKTLLFRPFQRKAMTVKGVTTDNTDLDNPTLLGPSSYPNPNLIPNGWNGPKDDAQVLTVGLQMGYAIPQEYMPRFGRQDIPYYQDNGPVFGNGNFLEGLNHLFLDSTNLTDPVFHILGGDDNLSGGTLVTRFLIQTGTTSGLNYSQYGTITGTLSQAYQGRLVSEIGTTTPLAQELTRRIKNIASSDFGVGLDGIQMPPYVGLARVYGVYDRRDFVAAGGITYQADRVTPEPLRATNLLRRDATKQTLYILQHGAQDLTGAKGDHTYIIPKNTLDITKSPFYAAGERFEDLEYVVECTIFCFARGFIDQNNYAMARRHNSQGDLISDGDNPELIAATMCIPAAAPDSSRAYMEYNRVVYQGDPYGSKTGDVQSSNDYTNRYGQVPQSDAFGLDTPIQQFDGDGNIIPERPNARSFEVLASIDFYTTLGTGKMGGKLFPGTLTDVGYTEPAAFTRIPESATQPAWRILTRAFTEGQKESTSRASGVLEVVGSNATVTFLPNPNATRVTVRKIDGTPVFFRAFNGPTIEPDEFDASSPDPTVIARELWEKIKDREALKDTVAGFNDIDSTEIEFVAVPTGIEGNKITIEINDTDTFYLNVSKSGEEGLDAIVTLINLSGGLDTVANGGTGTSQLDTTGMTERFPLGILLQDSDFIGENPLGDAISAFQTYPGGIRPPQTLLPLTQSGGEEFTRFTGGPGELIGMSDGSLLQYQAFTDDTPGGTKRYRLFRGGGSVFMLSGKNPGGPIDWVSGSFESSVKPVLKGGLLACKALLVRNFPEVAFSSGTRVSEGDEIQMVLLTKGILGNGQTVTEGIDMDGIISPTGYGEGYAAADRYRLNGKPMFQGRFRTTPDPAEVPLAFYPGREDLE